MCSFDLPKAQQELADRLEIEKKADAVDILCGFINVQSVNPVLTQQ